MTTVFVKRSKRRWLQRERSAGQGVTSSDSQTGDEHVNVTGDHPGTAGAGDRPVVAAQSELGLRAIGDSGHPVGSPRRAAGNRTLITDEFDDALGAPTEEKQSHNAVLAVDIVQRPNAVIRNGGPQLLRGLMLPLCPSSNRYWRSMPMVKKGTAFPLVIRSFKELYSKIRAITHPSDDARDYVKSIKELAIQKGFMFNTEKPLRVDIVVCPRDRREIDAHNYAKVLLDAFEQAQVFADDAQAVDVRTRLGPIIKGGRVVVSMWEVQHDANAVLSEVWQ